MSKRIVIGIAGASGVTYGIRMLECLKETATIFSSAGGKTMTRGSVFIRCPASLQESW